MKYCPSFKIVDLMSSGCGPQDACKKVVKDILDREPGEIEMGVVALDMKVSNKLYYWWALRGRQRIISSY